MDIPVFPENYQPFASMNQNEIEKLKDKIYEYEKLCRDILQDMLDNCEHGETVERLKDILGIEY